MRSDVDSLCVDVDLHEYLYRKENTCCKQQGVKEMQKKIHTKSMYGSKKVLHKKVKNSSMCNFEIAKIKGGLFALLLFLLVCYLSLFSFFFSPVHFAVVKSNPHTLQP